jgi:hypothetical protein
MMSIDCSTENVCQTPNRDVSTILANALKGPWKRSKEQGLPWSNNERKSKSLNGAGVIVVVVAVVVAVVVVVVGVLDFVVGVSAFVVGVLDFRY